MILKGFTMPARLVLYEIQEYKFLLIDHGAITLKAKLLAFFSTWMLAGTVHAGLILEAPDLGVSILGGSMLVADDGHVQAEFLGSDAGYFNTIKDNTMAKKQSGTISKRMAKRAAQRRKKRQTQIVLALIAILSFLAVVMGNLPISNFT